MSVTLKEMKNYLRVDVNDDDELIKLLISSAEILCMNVIRTSDVKALYRCKNAKPAVMYAVNYMYEHRTDGDFKALSLSLRSLLCNERMEIF